MSKILSLLLVFQSVFNVSDFLTSPAVETIEGILLGFSMPVSSSLSPCIKDDKVIMDHALKAIEELKKKDAESVMKGLQEMAAMVKLVPSALAECKQVEQDFKALIQAAESITNGWSFVYHAGKELLINGVQIFKYSLKIETDFQAGDYRSFGKDIGSILEMILIGIKPEEAQSRNFTSKEKFLQAMQAFEGVLIGFGEASSVDFQQCIKDDTQIIDDFKEAVDMLIINKDKKVLKGLKKLATTVMLIPKAVKDCSSAGEQLNNLNKALESMKHPVKFAFHVGHDLVINGVQIFNDVHDMIHDYNQIDFYNFGKHLGDALEKLLIGDLITQSRIQNFQINDDFVALNEQTPTIQVLEGIVLGFGEAVSPNFSTCVNDDSEIFKQIMQAADDLQHIKKPASVIKGLKELAEVAKNVPEAIRKCGATIEDLQNLEKAIANLSSFKNFIFHVGKDIMVNHVQLYHDIQNMLEAIKDHRYKDFGMAIGDALDKLVEAKE